MTTTNVSVPEIHCPSCEKLIQMGLKKLPGVISISFKGKTAIVEHDANVDKNKIVKQIKDTTGYSAS